MGLTEKEMRRLEDDERGEKYYELIATIKQMRRDVNLASTINKIFAK